MKKRTIIILASVVAVCVLGLLASLIINWPVNTDSTEGNIGKSSRFFRKTTTERIDNLEELLRNDEDYKNSIVLAYTIMETRTMQFGALVDLSNQAAGNIPEFADVLQDMNELVPLITNVSEAIVAAGSDLNTILSGESCSDVTESTINASLAYTTLQKQNTLASRFIDTADKYVKKAEATETLQFVRDQWVDYMKMTAALEGDTKAAKKLLKKEALLTPEHTLNALNKLETPYQAVLLHGADLSGAFEVGCILKEVVNAPELLSLVPDIAFEVFRFSNIEPNNKLRTHNVFEPQILQQADDTQLEHATGDDILLNGKYTPRVFYNRESVENILNNLNTTPAISQFGKQFEFAHDATGLINERQHLDVCHYLDQVIDQTAQGFTPVPLL